LLITREFPPQILGGISYYLWELCETLTVDHDVTVLAGTCNESRHKPIAGPGPDVDLEWVPFGSMKGYHLRYPYALWQVLRDVDVSDFDVAYAHTPLPFSIDIPTMTHYHDSERAQKRYAAREYGPLKRTAHVMLEPSRRFVDRRSLNTSDYYVFNSELCKNAWKRHYQLSAEYEVVYNGVDCEKFAPEPGRDDYVLFVGDSRRKGIDRVIEFAKQSDRRVVIVGDPPYDTDHLDVRTDVEHEELRSLYARAHALIHPARFEAFGNVILESLACGTPVVVSENCGAAEIIDDSTGVVTDDLSQGVSLVSRCDPRSCRELAQQYTWEKIGGRVESVLSGVAADTERAPVHT
jgi:glycosyltransferase involved in cell wall biosynthesis